MGLTHGQKTLLYIIFIGPRSSAERDEAQTGSVNPDLATGPVLTGLNPHQDPKDLPITDEEKELMRLEAKAKNEGESDSRTLTLIRAH